MKENYLAAGSLYFSCSGFLNRISITKGGEITGSSRSTYSRINNACNILAHRILNSTTL
jgi:hypothetical protein